MFGFDRIYVIIVLQVVMILEVKGHKSTTLWLNIKVKPSHMI